MQDMFGSVRRSLKFRQYSGREDGDSVGGGGGRFVEKIGTCLRKSRVGFGLGLGFLPKLPSLPQISNVRRDISPAIRWRKGELIGCGAFGHVYMGMNIDSGELLAVKQVLIGTNNASKEKAQAHIRELEEEVKLLKNLSHPNIVRYLGTAREDNTLNILLEFVPGGSISSLLGKFGSFPEAVIKMYSKQLLQGLEYLHRNGIMHRDIKGANILVDNRGCIKLADFGASKQVAKLATMTAAKSMKGTPYWMAPEVILQTGHSFSADIWSVGCTIIEMATGKPPWSQQYQEVAALFHIGTTKSHPPIPDHLSLEAKDFLLKCLQKEPNLRPTPSDLLQHPFVTGEQIQQGLRGVVANDFNNGNGEKQGHACKDQDDDMCEVYDKDEESPVVGSEESFNPMSEPFDDDQWPCKFYISREPRTDTDHLGSATASISMKRENGFSFPSMGPLCEEDDEVIETKIRTFLDEKALDLKKLQTPLLHEFYNTVNLLSNNSSKTPPPCKVKRIVASNGTTVSPANRSRRRMSGILKEIPSPNINDQLGSLIRDPVVENIANISPRFSDRQKKWKEELDEELEREREMMRKTASPKEKIDRCTSSQKRDRLRFSSSPLLRDER